MRSDLLSLRPLHMLGRCASAKENNLKTNKENEKNTWNFSS